MKKLLRNIIVSSTVLYILSQLFSGMVFERGIVTIIITGVALTLSFMVAKPVINILLLPLNLITFGLFRWVSSIAVFYLVTLVVKEFKITQFYFPGYSSLWIDLPEIALAGFLSYVAFAFCYSIITSLLHWLFK